MYDLRSRKRSIESQVDTQIKETSNNDKKRKTTPDHDLYSDISKESFNPELFDKGNEYQGISDSSDSESEDNYISSNVDDEYIPLDSTILTTSSPDILDTNISDEDVSNISDEDLSDDILDSNISDKDYSDEYFGANTDSLIGLITKRINAKFPDLSEHDIRKAVNKALNKARTHLVQEYCDVEPKDNMWKIDVNSDEIDKLEPELKHLRKNIKDNVPTIPKILKSNLLTSEKERALQMYDALNNMEPYTGDYMYLSMKLSEMIKTAPTELDPVMNNKLTALRSKIVTDIPTLEKIMNARLTESDKIRALQLYDILQQQLYNTDDWFDAQYRIKAILDVQLSTDDELNRMELQEASMKDIVPTFHADLKRKIFELDADITVKSRIYEMYSRMISSGISDNKYSEIKDKILWAIKLPYRKILTNTSKVTTPDEISVYCINMYNKLNTRLYGMDHAKEKAVQIVNDRLYNPNSRSILALRGKPGVGKTKLAKAIAEAAGMAFDKISLGGAIDSSLFKGSDNVWSGSSPSLLLQILSRVKCSNAVILLDEIDKLGNSDKGLEVQNSLLHVLDATQNKEFQDMFLCEFPHDISKIWFIASLNDDSKLSATLRDRLHIIDLPAYGRSDMIQIIKLHTLPDCLIDKGIAKDDITITDEACNLLLTTLGQQVVDTGMRPIECAIDSIISKINLLRTLNGAQTLPLTYKLADFAGFPYIITPDTISALCKPNKDNHSYEFMFL